MLLAVLGKVSKPFGMLVNVLMLPFDRHGFLDWDIFKALIMKFNITLYNCPGRAGMQKKINASTHTQLSIYMHISHTGELYSSQCPAPPPPPPPAISLPDWAGSSPEINSSIGRATNETDVSITPSLHSTSIHTQLSLHCYFYSSGFAGSLFRALSPS